jgi:hypothetical protein
MRHNCCIALKAGFRSETIAASLQNEGLRSNKIASSLQMQGFKGTASSLKKDGF